MTKEELEDILEGLAEAFDASAVVLLFQRKRDGGIGVVEQDAATALAVGMCEMGKQFFLANTFTGTGLEKQ